MELSKASLVKRLWAMAGTILLCLVLLAISLYQAPVSVSYICVALGAGWLSAVFAYFVFSTKRENLLMCLILPAIELHQLAARRCFESDVYDRYYWWLLAQWMALFFIPFYLAIIIMAVRKFNDSIEKPTL